MCVCVSVFAMVCVCLRNPEECVRYPGAKVTGSCEQPDMGAGF